MPARKYMGNGVWVDDSGGDEDKAALEVAFEEARIVIVGPSPARMRGSFPPRSWRRDS